MSPKKDRDAPPPVPERLPAPAVDSHTHLDACGDATAASVTALLDRAGAAGIERVVTVADDLAAARWAAEAADPPAAWAVAGCGAGARPLGTRGSSRSLPARAGEAADLGVLPTNHS